jgi:hypothetical protein
MARWHMSQVIAWTIMLPVALLTGLKNSVPFLVGISILALIYSEWASWQAAMGERRMDDSDAYGQSEGIEQHGGD